MSKVYSDKVLSLALSLSAAAWGLYWLPLRAIENTGISGTWGIALFNACPLIILCPLLLLGLKKPIGVLGPTFLAALFIGLAFTLYANGLMETTVVRAILLFYLTPVWSTLIGVMWLSERLTRARIVSIVVAISGLFLLLSGGESSGYSLNMGDLYSFLSGIFWAMGLATLNRWSNIPILPLTAIVFISTTVMSAMLAGFFYGDPVPDITLITSALPTAAFWSIVILLPSFFVIFRISQLLFPGRVGILTMSEVVVAIISAAILLPEETMVLMQWVGAVAILLAGLIEVVFGYTKKARVEQS